MTGRGPSRASANHLRAWRVHRGLTQEQLAELVDTTGNVISLLESGARQLGARWLARLAPALGTRPGFLLEFEPGHADLSALETLAKLPASRRAEALRLLAVFCEGADAG